MYDSFINQLLLDFKETTDSPDGMSYIDLYMYKDQNGFLSRRLYKSDKFMLTLSSLGHPYRRLKNKGYGYRSISCCSGV